MPAEFNLRKELTAVVHCAARGLFAATKEVHARTRRRALHDFWPEVASCYPLRDPARKQPGCPKQRHSVAEDESSVAVGASERRVTSELDGVVEVGCDHVAAGELHMSRFPQCPTLQEP